MTATPTCTVLCDLYLRLSDDKHEGGTFEDRVERLRARAVQRGWTVRNVVIENDVISGDGKRAKRASAFKRRKTTGPDGRPVERVWRPGFQQILDDLATSHIQALLTEDLDRAVRDPRDLEDLIDVCRRHKAWADSISGSLCFTAGGTDSEITMARIMVTMAHKSSLDTSRRVAAARLRNAEAGKSGGGARPYGFEPGGMVIRPEEAEVIRWMAGEVLSESFGRPDGPSLRGIARHLRERGTPAAGGGQWSSKVVGQVLSKARNAGIITYYGEEMSRLEGDPILHEDIWRAVVAKLNDPARRSGRGPATRFLGSGLYLCICGSVVEIHAGTVKDRAYRCARKGGTGSQHIRRNVALLDDRIGRLICERLSQPDAADLVVARPSAAVDVKALRAQVAAQREKLEELARDYADDLITREQRNAGTEKARSKLADAEAQLGAVTERSPLSELIRADDVDAAWRELSVGARRTVLDALMTVTIRPATRPLDPTAVHVQWKR